MRINTADTYEWQKDLYADMSDLFNENTRSVGIDSIYLFSWEMMANLERAMHHPAMTPGFAALLSRLKASRKTDSEKPLSRRGW